ncbi:MAG: polysaccharide deacetylase family protein, partial [Anaerolineae bacterium]
YRSVARVSHTRYPAFLFGRPVGRDEIPAFIYHDVDMESFEADLYFLHDNGYRTLTTDEFVSSVDQGLCERAVLLTFDDAGQNFFDVTLPLLKKYGAKATVFAPTYWIGRDTGKSADEMNSGGKFMSWEQLRECSETGLVDIQSHAHRHALVHISDSIVNFATPELLDRQHFYDWPMRWSGGEDMIGPPPLGTPIYSSQPLLSAPHRLLEDPAVFTCCQEFVESEGSRGFFATKGWRSELTKVYQAARAESSGPKYLDANAFEELLASEFDLSQQLFLEKLGRKAEHLAFPWMLGSTQSLKLASERGIKVFFGVGLDFGRVRKLSGQFRAFGRIKGDWLRFLPGRGRLKLSEVLPDKIKSFFSAQHLAH